MDTAIAVVITAIATIANNVYILSCEVGYFGLSTFGFIFVKRLFSFISAYNMKRKVLRMFSQGI